MGEDKGRGIRREEKERVDGQGGRGWRWEVGMGGEVGVRRWFAFTNTCSPTSYYRCWEEKDVWCSRTILLVWDLVGFEKKKRKRQTKDDSSVN